MKNLCYACNKKTISPYEVGICDDCKDEFLTNIISMKNKKQKPKKTSKKTAKKVTVKAGRPVSDRVKYFMRLDPQTDKFLKENYPVFHKAGKIGLIIDDIVLFNGSKSVAE